MTLDEAEQLAEYGRKSARLATLEHDNAELLKKLADLKVLCGEYRKACKCQRYVMLHPQTGKELPPVLCALCRKAEKLI